MKLSHDPPCSLVESPRGNSQGISAHDSKNFVTNYKSTLVIMDSLLQLTAYHTVLLLAFEDFFSTTYLLYTYNLQNQLSSYLLTKKSQLKNLMNLISKDIKYEYIGIYIYTYIEILDIYIISTE